LAGGPAGGGDDVDGVGPGGAADVEGRLNQQGAELVTAQRQRVGDGLHVGVADVGRRHLPGQGQSPEEGDGAGGGAGGGVRLVVVGAHPLEDQAVVNAGAAVEGQAARRQGGAAGAVHRERVVAGAGVDRHRTAQAADRDLIASAARNVVAADVHGE